MKGSFTKGRQLGWVVIGCLFLCGIGHTAATKTYDPGTPMEVTILWPQAGANYGDAHFMGIGYGLNALAKDYDNVTCRSADGNTGFTNRERTKPEDFRCVWTIVNDDGKSGSIVEALWI